MTLYWDKTGPTIKYANGMLLVEDLNPQGSIKFTMSRTEMLRLGFRCLLSALKP